MISARRMFTLLYAAGVRRLSSTVIPRNDRSRFSSGCKGGCKCRRSSPAVASMAAAGDYQNAIAPTMVALASGRRCFSAAERDAVTESRQLVDTHREHARAHNPLGVACVTLARGRLRTVGDRGLDLREPARIGANHGRTTNLAGSRSRLGHRRKSTIAFSGPKFRTSWRWRSRVGVASRVENDSRRARHTYCSRRERRTS